MVVLERNERATGTHMFESDVKCGAKGTAEDWLVEGCRHLEIGMAL